MTERTTCAGGEGENGPGVPEKRQNRGKSDAECRESVAGPGRLPRAQMSREFLLWSAHRAIQCMRAAAQEGIEPGTEESRQADPVSRSKSAQKRQYNRTEEDDSAYCLMHASPKQSLRSASSGSPDNALHSLVLVSLLFPPFLPCLFGPTHVIYNCHTHLYACAVFTYICVA